MRKKTSTSLLLGLLAASLVATERLLSSISFSPFIRKAS